MIAFLEHRQVRLCRPRLQGQDALANWKIQELATFGDAHQAQETLKNMLT